MRRYSAVLLVGVLVAGCSGSDSGTAETTSPAPDLGTRPATTDQPATTEGPVEDAPTGLADDASIEEALAAAPVPDLVDTSAERPCERWGYACDPLAVDDEALDETMAALDAVTAAMTESDDAREQLRVGLVALDRIDGVGHVEADVDTATMLSFTIDGGPRVAAITAAGELQEGGDVTPVDESFVPPPATAAEPQGFAGTGLRGARTAGPQRYEPVGGPLNGRSAAVYNPFEWESAGAIAAIFQADDEYTVVDVFNGSEVNPFTVERAGGYDAVHIITHGGGSCPSWTDDRSECGSTFVGGEFDADLARAEMAAADRSVGLDFFLCESGGTTRYCFSSNAFPSNPNGIVFFNSCGSDFGFNQTGAGASVGWTGTTQQRVAERTAAEFWRLMVTDGVEFELAKEIVHGSGLDSHQNTFWASGGSVNAFTSAMFQGRNLRARDVVEMRLDGAEPQGQVLQFTGRPQDGQPETFPAEDQQITFEVEGVRDGTENGVTIEIRGDDTEWKSDIDLARNGSAVEPRDGYATWRVTLDPGSVEIPDLAWSDLDPSRAPVEIEVRAFESSSEYTAYEGSVRLGTEVEFSGPLPFLDEIRPALAPDGEVDGNDLRVEIDTGSGELTGSLLAEISGSAGRVGTWRFDLEGTYDPESGVVDGQFTASTRGGVFDMVDDETESGTFTGRANLPSETIQLQLDIAGRPQVYNGTIVD